MPYYKGFQEQKDAIKKLQQATNPETPISYREFIKLASNTLNCSFAVDSYTKDKKLIYRGFSDNKGLTTFTSTPNGIEKVIITDNVVYTK